MNDFDSIKLPGFIKEEFEKYRNLNLDDFLDLNSLFKNMIQKRNEIMKSIDNFKFKVLSHFHLSNFIIMRLLKYIDELSIYYIKSLEMNFDNSICIYETLLNSISFMKDNKDSVLKEMMESIETLRKMNEDSKEEDGIMIDLIRSVNETLSFKGKGNPSKAHKANIKKNEEKRKGFIDSGLDENEIISKAILLKENNPIEAIEVLNGIAELENIRRLILKINDFRIDGSFISFSDKVLYYSLLNGNNNIWVLDSNDNFKKIDIKFKKIIYGFKENLFYLESNGLLKTYDIRNGNEEIIANFGFDSNVEYKFHMGLMTFVSISDDIKRISVYDIFDKTVKTIATSIDSSVLVKNGMLFIELYNKKEVFGLKELNIIYETETDSCVLGVNGNVLTYVLNEEIHVVDLTSGKDEVVTRSVKNKECHFVGTSLFYRDYINDKIYRYIIPIKTKYEIENLNIETISNLEYKGHHIDDLSYEFFMEERLESLFDIDDLDDNLKLETIYQRSKYEIPSLVREAYDDFKGLKNGRFLGLRKMICAYIDNDSFEYDDLFFYDSINDKELFAFSTLSIVDEDESSFKNKRKREIQNSVIEDEIEEKADVENVIEKPKKGYRTLNVLLFLSSFISFVLFSSIVYFIIEEYFL